MNAARFCAVAVRSPRAIVQRRPYRLDTPGNPLGSVPLIRSCFG